jgi:hypothetical protein
MMNAYTVQGDLIFRGDTLDPELLTVRIGVCPNECCRKGDPHPRSTRYPPRRTGLWALESDVSLSSVDSHVNYLLSKVQHLTSQDLKLLNVDVAKLCIRIYTEVHPLPEPALDWQVSSQQVRELARLGIALHCMIY